MEKLTSKEFFDQLKANTLKPAFTLKGIVKKSENDSELLFTRKGDFINWIKIPSSAIESVIVLKTFSKEDKTFVVVKLHLKPPTSPEGKLFYELLSSIEKEETAGRKCGSENKSMCSCGCGGMKGHCRCGEGAEHFTHHCESGCHQDNHGGFDSGQRHD